MMTVCPICRKSVCIHWPEHWVYRRGQTYYCSDQCMDVDITRTTKLLNEALRKKRKGKIDMKQKITLAMKQKAVEMAIKGEDPLAYLKKCGSKNPSASWAYIKTTLEKKDPAMFAKLPERLPKTAGDAIQGTKDAADEFFGKCTEMGLNVGTYVETPEGNWMPVETPEPIKSQERIEFKIRGIEGQFGLFFFDHKHNMIDWTSPEGEEVSMDPAHWRMFIKQMPRVIEVLMAEGAK